MLKAAGPWPPAVGADPGNRYSGDAKAIELGEVLFKETRLSRTGSISCASCHDPDAGYDDGRPVAVGLGQTQRNTPTVVNMVVHRWFGWDGAADSLWAQSIRPILSPLEMDGAKAVRTLYEEDADFNLAFRELFGAEPALVSDELMLALTGKALAAYQETLVTEPTSFDEFRIAVLDGKPLPEKMSESAVRGAKLFFGRAQCVLCHFGPGFTNGEFASIALAHMTPEGDADRGRYLGIKLVRSSPFNRLGQYDDDVKGVRHGLIKSLRQRPDAFGEFKVPGLREVVKTAPYMHDGSLTTLEAVVRHYNDVDTERLHGEFDTLPKPLGLNNDEIADLVEFLKTL